jgi:hypothetical protein
MPKSATRIGVSLFLVALCAAGAMIALLGRGATREGQSAPTSVIATLEPSIDPTPAPHHTPDDEPAPTAPAGHPADALAPIIDERLYELTPRPEGATTTP